MQPRLRHVVLEVVLHEDDEMIRVVVIIEIQGVVGLGGE